MNDEKKRKFSDRIEALNQKYCDQLPEKYLEIENSWIEYQADLKNESALELFYRLIHTLKGTAATFGFVTQADICFEIQKILMPVKEENKSLTTNLVSEIQDHIYDLKINISSPAHKIED